LTLRLSYQAFRAIHPAMFGQALVMRMFREQKILTQMCGNNFMVLKSAPPLVATEATLQTFVDAAEQVVREMHTSTTFWTEPLMIARRAVNLA
jgi:ornithine--oxo-acid transaminase